MKTNKQLRIGDLQEVRGSVESRGTREEYSRNTEDGTCKYAEIVRNFGPTSK